MRLLEYYVLGSHVFATTRPLLKCGLRAEETELCALAIFGVNAGGRKLFLAIGGARAGLLKAGGKFFSFSKNAE